MNISGSSSGRPFTKIWIRLKIVFPWEGENKMKISRQYFMKLPEISYISLKEILRNKKIAKYEIKLY
jgi:hypothetical protein